MKQTAVEWLQKKYWKKLSTTEDLIIFQQAKEMEKQQQGYSEEEVLRIITSCKEYLSFGDEFNEKQWFEHFKKK
jgi:hypothetical protein